jgi:putative ABC transport system ATP-binding protein
MSDKTALDRRSWTESATAWPERGSLDVAIAGAEGVPGVDFSGGLDGDVAPPAVIELRNVSRTFEGPPPVHALRPSNLRIERGEYVSIIGPSGSGKSTLLNL